MNQSRRSELHWGLTVADLYEYDCLRLDSLETDTEMEICIQGLIWEHSQAQQLESKGVKMGGGKLS